MCIRDSDRLSNSAHHPPKSLQGTATLTTAFDARYRQLNAAQRQAVDAIDGPLLVVAGPGTGKTELLGMRAANILRSTDTLPENILCLTFTDSGAAAMRERLAGIIGPDAYRVAIHTFHSFGTEVINQNNQYFYHGAAFRPADEVTMHQVLSEIFDELDYTNPLASKNNGEHTHLKDTMSTCLLYTSPSPRDRTRSRMPSSA